jgi:DNA-binding PadR family transcriptional regulator
LEQRGWIEALPSEDRRRPYQITAAGVTVLREQLITWSRVISTGLQRLPAI